jgi:HEAT repeat protein
MGLFDLFKSKGGGKDGEKKSNAAAKYAEAAASKRAQAYDRQEAIAELCKLKSADAVEALLKRFTFATDPSITDQEEKEAAFEGIVGAGREAIEPVRAFAAKAESVAWPVRILKEILPEEELVGELLVWLKRWDTEYAKFIDPKLQILQQLEEYEHPEIREAVEAFLQDVNEPARFYAVAATFKQKDPEAIEALLVLLLDEESVRVRGKVADGFVAMKWEIPEDQRDAVRKVLPPQYTVDGAGLVTKRGG